MYSSWGITKEINNYRVNFEDPPWDTHAPIRGVAIRRWIKSSGDLRRYTKVFCLKIKQNHFSTPTRSDRFESRHKQLQIPFRSKYDSFRSKYDSFRSKHDSYSNMIHSDQSTIQIQTRLGWNMFSLFLQWPEKWPFQSSNIRKIRIYSEILTSSVTRDENG